jgi:hypothetical protein
MVGAGRYGRPETVRDSSWETPLREAAEGGFGFELAWTYRQVTRWAA